VSWKRKIIKAVQEAGWEVREGKKHTLLVPPDGESRPIPISRGTTREQGRGQANIEACLRRHGVDV
jgi:hypothetical protein